MTHAYPILTTDAFILHTHNGGEADRTVVVLTRERGVMYVYARSIRKETAKMRMMVLPYNRVHMSVIIGKRNILKDIVVTDPFRAVWGETGKYTALVRLLHCVHTLIPPLESKDVRIFAVVEEAVRALERSDGTYAPHILLVAQVSILNILGYVHNDHIQNNPFETVMHAVATSAEKRRDLERHLRIGLHHQ